MLAARWIILEIDFCEKGHMVATRRQVTAANPREQDKKVSEPWGLSKCSDVKVSSDLLFFKDFEEKP